ncbi:MAG: GNAT family N-acetyltransferase, partial [Nocardioidaceae bacterium]|nr:GNAT family N-acetyltransferase [Nocardioidaceae bacterium]
MTRTDSLLATLETYYDTAPRANATVEEVGPFTLFVKARQATWDYYARPRLGHDGEVTRADVDAVRARQRELGVPENLEWVHETTPSLLAAARASGLPVEECPLLVLAEPVPPVPGVDVRVLGPDADLGAVVGAIGAGFEGTDEVRPAATTRQPAMM